jgi:hypothetical protein
MNNTSQPVLPPIKPLRVTVGALVSSLVVFGVVVYGIDKSGSYPPSWVFFTLGGLAVCSHLLSQRLGFNLKPIPTGTPPAEAMAMAAVAFRSSTYLRFFFSQPVALVALSLSFAVLPASWMTYLIGAVLTLVLIGVNVWPSPAIISKAQQRLDRDGGRSFLRDALFGLAPDTTTSAISRS